MRTKNNLLRRSSKAFADQPIPFVAKLVRRDQRSPENHKENPPILTDEELLDLYLGLSSKERDGMFADTARAAEIVGLSQRTIQLWIEIGLIRAILLGGKYKICLHSLKDFLRSKIEQQAV
jgi:excisionase family DNA binding protein